MSENEDQSPYGRGFVAACIVIGAVLLCGALLLITTLTSDPSDTSASTTPVASDPATPTITAGSANQPATPGAEPATASASGQPASSANTCGLPDGDQSVPTKPPSVDGWDVSRRVVVPRSATYGPAKTDPDGFRHCFAHSPTGAVLAAYNAVAALADQKQAIPTVKKLMLPGPDTQVLIRAMSKEEPSDSGTVQLAGYRVLDANHDRATVMLAVPIESAYMSLTLTLIWHDNDWRLQPPPPGEAVGAPFSQHRDLNDFTAWSGV
jgi:hypothetical protein